MAIIFSQTLPEGVTIDLVDAVTAEMGVKTDPPAGMIVHTHYEEGGRVRITDVWESADAHAKFVGERLAPAMVKVATEAGIDNPMADQPEAQIIEVHDIVLGP
jgi:hypothetical protein